MNRKFVAIILACLLGVGAYFVAYSIASITASAPNEHLEGLPTIVIDAGHGGYDGGAVGVDNIVEKDINLSIAKKLYDMMQINGFDVVLTRDCDESLHDDDRVSNRKKKTSDIRKRLAIAKSYDRAILLSIHQNKFIGPRYFGAQVFYGPKNQESERFGKIMQTRFVNMLQSENTRLSKKCGDSVYLIYNAPMPALLIECGFLSNPKEAHLLNTDEYQQKVAFTIFCGTMEYLGLEYKEGDLDSPSSEIEQGTKENGSNEK